MHRLGGQCSKYDFNRARERRGQMLLQPLALQNFVHYTKFVVPNSESPERRHP